METLQFKALISSLNQSMLALAQDPQLPVYVAICLGLSVLCFAVGTMLILNQKHSPASQPKPITNDTNNASNDLSNPQFI